MFRNFIKSLFNLYDIVDLKIGGHCGICGRWMAHDIMPQEWPWSMCVNCETKGGDTKK